MSQLKISTAFLAVVLISCGFLFCITNFVTSASAVPTTTAPNTSASPTTHPFKLRNDAPRLSPFTAVRWNDQTAEVQYKSASYQIISIDDVSEADVMDYLTQSGDAAAQKHFAEDLVEVMRDMRHPIGKTVKLILKTLDTEKQVVISNAAMTEENRHSAMKNAKSSL